MNESLQNKLILYVDILGFSNYVKDPSFSEKNITALKDLFKKYNRSQTFEKRDNYRYDLKFNSTLFSDSFLVSIPEFLPAQALSVLSKQFRQGAKKIGVQGLIFSACEFQETLFLEFNLLVRGVIHYGKLLHEGHFIIGKGFIEAYDIEKKLINPAIYLSDEVKEIYKNEIERELKKGDKHTFYREEGKETYIFPATLISKDNSQRTRAIIKKGKEKAKENSRALGKWHWMENTIDSWATK